MGSRSRSFRRHNGQSLVELAVVLPVLVLLFAMAVDLSSVFYYSTAVTSAAREGARYGALHPSDAPGIVSRAVGEPGSTIALDPGLVTTSYDSTSVYVTVSHQLNPITPVLQSVWNGRVSGSASMPIMGQ